MLIVMGIAAGLVAPTFLPPRRPDDAPLATLLRGARETAARRGESLYLDITASGQWRLEGAASTAQGVLASGILDAYRGPAGTLLVSPLGTCAFDARSAAAAQAIPIDPLVCEPR